ncbi:MAG: trypsin-like peptidase domain-containing protein [Anaerolineales bacterium]|nr:trypsin-like peptidase domain-containing protein [Anaerolineales bacterium]
MSNEINPLLSLSNAMADAVESAGEATVTVLARRRMPASGVAYAPNLILTADHVVEMDDDIKIGLPNGEERPATLAGRDPGSDLAILRLTAPMPSIASPITGDARVGQLALALGRPGSSGIQASLGIVSAIGSAVRVVREAGPEAEGHGRHSGPGQGRHPFGRHHHRGKTAQVAEQFIRTDAIPYPGFSGGPLIDAAGNVIGINTSGLLRGMSIAIPASRAWQIAAALDQHGSVKRGYLGIRSQPVPLNAEMQAALGREQASGLLLVWIEEGSPAAQGGLFVGDILVSLAGDPVTDPDELQLSLSGEIVGQPTSVEVLRGGQPAVITVTVGTRE